MRKKTQEQPQLWFSEQKTEISLSERHSSSGTRLVQRICLITGLLLILIALIMPVFIYRSIKVASSRLKAVESMDLTLSSLSVKAQKLYGRDFNSISRDSFLETSRSLSASYRWIEYLYGTDDIPGNLRNLWDFTEPYILEIANDLNQLNEGSYDMENPSISSYEFAILDDSLRKKLGESRYSVIKTLFHNLIFFSTEIVPQYSRALQSAIVSLNHEKLSTIRKLEIPAYIFVFALILLGARTILKHFSRQKEEVEEARNRNQYLKETVKERTAELRSKNRLLEEAKDIVVEREKMAAMGQLVAGVAHEMNTPLGVAVTAVSYIGEVVGREDPDNEIAQMSNLAVSNLNRVSNLMERFKNLAVSNDVEVHRTFDLMEHLRNYILPSIIPELEKKGHKLVLEGPDYLDIHGMFGDYSQIIIQLIENCSLHGYKGTSAGEIRIMVESNDSGVLITVADDGVGIDDDAGARIYEPFFTTGRSQGGIGLGLTLVYNIVNHKLGGNINYKSAPGEGTAVTVFIPFT